MGTVTISTGVKALNKLRIGGQEFWIDNICAFGSIPLVPQATLSNKNAAVSVGDLLDEDLSLQVSPNPVSNHTTITYNVRDNDHVNVSVYNYMGQLVKILLSGTQSPSSYSLNWNATDMNGSNVLNGIYFVRVQTKHGVQTAPIIVGQK